MCASGGPFVTLEIGLICVHLGAFRRANQFKRLSSSRFPIWCASWCLFAEQTYSSTFPLRASPFSVHLGAFRKAIVCILGKFKRLSALAFPILCASWGLFAEQAHSNAFPLQGFLCCVHLGAFRRASKFKRLSSSKLPILRFHKAGKFQRLSSLRFPILRAKQARLNALPLRGFLSCVHLGAFCRANKF